LEGLLVARTARQAKQVKQTKQTKHINQIKRDIKYEITGLGMVLVACLGFVSLYSSERGVLGDMFYRTLSTLAGTGKILIPLMLIFVGIQIMNRKHHNSMKPRSGAATGLFVLFLAFLHLQISGVELLNRSEVLELGKKGQGGGVIGATIAYGLKQAFGMVGGHVVIFGLALVFVMLLTNRSIIEGSKVLWQKTSEFVAWVWAQLRDFLFVVVEDEEAVPVRLHGKDKGNKAIFDSMKATEAVIRDIPVIINGKEYRGAPQEEELPETLFPELKPKQGVPEIPQAKEKLPGTLTGTPISRQVAREGNQDYSLPPMSLLQQSMRLKNTRLNKDITDNVKTLEDTLESFGVRVKVTQVTRGPAITRYEAQPAPGVKVSKIVNLADDIALSLAAQDVRIEAPIPGKAAVGIEVPNKDVATVHFREVLEAPEFMDAGAKLSVALGKDIAGASIVADLSKMPHLLIAGATGSGKSVCMNTLITSILFKAKPNEVKFLMVDPKMVELTNYNGIPHLISPVVTDPKKAASALKWVVTEMETRYELFATAGVRDIVRYNFLKSQENPTGPSPALPYVVVLIDELADLMMVAPGDVEDAICRLAQMARAAGIHLVVATQRPSVDVITGIIKANIPSRIAFAVSSQIDSRTILDMNGAEKLLGRGDMLFYPMGASKPVRVQGCFVSDKEVEAVVKFLQAQGKPEYQEVQFSAEVSSSQPQEEEDELFYDAAKLFIENGMASVSLLQRRLRVGYTRAARLVDLLEEKGVVGPYEGSKPREVLLSISQFEQKCGKKN
jgi:DNA segregation ATPase FtsK/SpoIIIE, S-DNA-T family